MLQQKQGFKTRKQLYQFSKNYIQKDFPPFPSFQLFNEGMNKTAEYFVTIAGIAARNARKKGSHYHVIDSTPLSVCNNQYRYRARVFKGLASSGKNMNGRDWGF